MGPAAEVADTAGMEAGGASKDAAPGAQDARASGDDAPMGAEKEDGGGMVAKIKALAIT